MRRDGRTLDHGTLERIHHALYVQCREVMGRAASPTACVIAKMRADHAALLAIVQRIDAAHRKHGPPLFDVFAPGSDP